MPHRARASNFNNMATPVSRTQTMPSLGRPVYSMRSSQSAVSSATSPSSGPVVATNNIINQRADASRSLYQICVNLKQRLAQVPGFEQHLHDDRDEDLDPVTSLWRCLLKGTPLMTIYNTLQPAEPLQIGGEVNAAKRPKVAAFKFVQACLKDLGLPPIECFVISDLFGDDTTGFVKVTQVINIVLDVAEQRGLLTTFSVEQTAATGQMSYRDYVVRELVDTERKYVQDLENLHELKKVMEEKGVVAGDVVHDIFLNINAILDFQRRFLIKIETTNSQPAARQEWGQLFVNFESYFSIYQPFIANQRKAAAVVMREFDKISTANHPVAVDFNTLDGFLLKPMQRLVKYPLLLKDLRDKTDADDATKDDLTKGIDAANRVLQLANDAVDREIRAEALEDLCHRVDDWKNHQVDQFGDLLLHGVFTVVTGKSMVEKEYTIYLFERILLCCKELAKDKKKKKKLQLKGRIFMTNVTLVMYRAKPGSYTIEIGWKSDLGVESFMIIFKNEEVMKKWNSVLDSQRKKCDGPTLPEAAGDFQWMRDQAANLANPYVQDDDDDDDDYPVRSRSTTSDSQMRALPLIQTQPSPMPDSYFSPVAESPASRNSASQYRWEDQTRYTAPAMARQPSRDSTGRSQRPSLPMHGQRSRSYSTPDINGRRPSNGVPAVPGIPAHLHPAYDAGIPRSQNSSPAGRTFTPPLNDLPSAIGGDLPMPTQLKVKVNCSGNYVTLVVALNITYQSLVDRIDAKVGRFSQSAISRGTMRLRYRDEDGDFVTIESDDDIQIAFQEWREQQQHHAGQLGEIELFCYTIE